MQIKDSFEKSSTIFWLLIQFSQKIIWTKIWSKYQYFWLIFTIKYSFYNFTKAEKISAGFAFLRTTCLVMHTEHFWRKSISMPFKIFYTFSTLQILKMNKREKLEFSRDRILIFVFSAEQLIEFRKIFAVRHWFFSCF